MHFSKAITVLSTFILFLSSAQAAELAEPSIHQVKTRKNGVIPHVLIPQLTFDGEALCVFLTSGTKLDKINLHLIF